MKRFFGVIITTLLLLCCNIAGAANFNVIVIERTDGVREHLQFDPAIVVKFTPETLLFVHPQIKVEYTLDEVANISYDKVASPGLYDGDHQSAIEAVAAPGQAVSISADEIKVGGTEPIVVYDMHGVEQARAASDGTAATLRASLLPAGVYVVRAGKVTFKVRI